MTKLNLLYILYIYSKQGGKGVNIFIDNKSGAPIYDQIYSQIKAQIIGGDLQEDESLPSIRSLAKDLRISVITTKRAYEELEKERIYLYSCRQRQFCGTEECGITA